MDHAIIDVGSNTIRLTIFEVDEKTHDIVQIYNRKLMAGLAGFVNEGGCLSKKGIERAIECIQSHQRRLKHFKVDSVSAFATAVIRNAANGEDACKKISKACDVPISILSGEEEATLGFFGAIHAIDATDGVLFDIGGGSTEIVHFRNGMPVFAASLPYGSLNLFLANVEGVLPTEREEGAIRRTIDAALDAADHLDEACYDTIFGVGGSARSMGKLADYLYHDGKKERLVSVDEMRRMLELPLWPGNSTLRQVLAVVPDRVHTVFPGMICADAIACRCEAKQVAIARYGVREGYLFSRVLGEELEMAGK